MRFWNPFVTWVIILALVSSQVAAAQDMGTGLTPSRDFVSGKTGVGNEYVSGEYPGAVLMRVNLWGAVGKPGIHFVPAQTDLISLLSYAGGPSESARLSGIYIKRWVAGKESLIQVDAEDILKGTEAKAPILQANDIIVVPKSRPLLSQDTVAVVGFLTSVLSLLALSMVYLKK